MSLFFSNNYGPVTVESFSHNEILDSAVDEVRRNLADDLGPWLDKVVFCVARVNIGNTVIPFAARHHSLMLYSASLLKVSILLASFELREAARELAGTLVRNGTVDPANQLEHLLKSELQSQPTRITQSAAKRLDVSSVLQVITIRNGELQLDFTEQYFDALQDIFLTQKNKPATFCIHKLGLAYINAALSNGGFFDSTLDRGMWLGGDYARGGFSGVSVATDDGLSSSQATNGEAMMRFMASISSEQLVNKASSKEMKDLLADVSFLSAMDTESLNVSYRIPKAKVGVGTARKPQISEAGIAVTSRGETFVYCWQNCNKVLPAQHIYQTLDIVFRNWP